MALVSCSQRTIAKYEEELSPTKYEKERQHQQLNAVFKKHQVVLHRTEEEEEPQLPHIKEEEEELCITQEGECLLGQEEADFSKFLLSVKTEEHEDKPPESSQLLHSPSCGPKEEFTSPWNRLCFDGDENNYGYWETKFLAYLHLLDLKSTILGEPPGKDDDSVEEDGNKNEEAYAVLIQLLDDKSLSLVMRDATDDGRKALQILRDHYAGKDKPCVVSLYTELTSLQKGVSESVADYIIRAETAITALRNAGQTLSDGLLAAVLLKGLPDVFKPFSVHVTQRDGNLTFAELKTKLRSYESAENVGAVDSGEDRRVKVEEEDHTLACKPGFEPQSLAGGVTDSGTLNLNEALNVQSFSKDIFTVRAETAQEATVLFIEGQNCLTPKNDVQQLIGHQEKPPQLLEWSSTLKQEDPQPPHIKEEKEELWIPQEGECLLGQEEADPLTVVSVKTEDHEDKTPESSQLHHSPTDVCQEHFRPEQEWSSRVELKKLPPPKIKEEEEPQPLYIKEEEEEQSISQHGALFEGLEVGGIVKSEGLLFVGSQSCFGQFLILFEEAAALLSGREGLLSLYTSVKPQEWTSRMEQEEPQSFHFKEEEAHQPLYIKEEEEEHSIGQEGEQLERLEEFPVIDVIVKSEDDEVKGESEEKKEAEPSSSSSTQHMTTAADGDHCGGSQADKLLAPLSDSEDTTSHSPDTDDEDSKEDKTCHTDNNHLKCSHCDKTFAHHCHLKIHTRTHTGEKPYMCTVCSKQFSRKESLIIHTRIHTGEKPFICSVCGKGFIQNSDLRKHTRIHIGVKPFSCSICDKSFTQKDTLKTHMRVHTGEKPFMCSVCSKRFSWKETLKKHTRIHTGEKPFCCLICGEGFIQSSDLKVHMRRHTGEKLFSCAICGEGFVHSQSLKVHMRRHTGEKPYSCSSCNKSFCDRSTLVMHMRTHTGERPYSCSICGKGFARNTFLTVHMRTHTGEKPHSCTSCDKSFCERSTLVKHMRTHTGEKVYSCSVCDKRFSYKYQINKHKCVGENISSCGTSK
ncbi:zinc finger protein 227-like [Nerophis ophidion]|uniref:zinc finger protein 227-like n=1 Tax=Nerophis ophidion TaxID=159077 RepID=UPI002ADF30AD|nr:zinc finger protein 227-like [Nerophis ophidion]